MWDLEAPRSHFSYPGFPGKKFQKQRKKVNNVGNYKQGLLLLSLTQDLDQVETTEHNAELIVFAAWFLELHEKLPDCSALVFRLNVGVVT